MKKICSAICCFSIALSYISASALEKMGKEGMSEIDARSGVTMTFSNVTATTNINKIGYGDNDGLGNGTTAGYLNVVGNISMLATITGSLKIDAGTAGVGGLTVSGSGTTPVVIPEGKSFVKMDLPNFRTDFTATSFDLYLNGTGPDAPATAGGTIGTIKVGAANATINGGSVYIYPH